MLSMFEQTYYVQLSAQKLTVKNLMSGSIFSEIPEIAIRLKPKGEVLAIGDQARATAAATSGGEVHNPFGHPRSLVSDFTLAEQLLKAAVRKLDRKTLLRFNPYIVMHPLGNPEGGYTQVELRALREMALGAGASKVTLWRGRALSDQEILSNSFPADGVASQHE
jgi:rod shape-determining protein MreB and related proteins